SVSRAFFIFSLLSYGDPCDLHSFPTRRSSDLEVPARYFAFYRNYIIFGDQQEAISQVLYSNILNKTLSTHPYYSTFAENFIQGRSEEHTSELQSRENLVCRLLLEKKKNY